MSGPLNSCSSSLASQSVAGVFNPQNGVNDVARQRRELETPANGTELPKPQVVKSDAAVIRALDQARENTDQNRTTFDRPDITTSKALNLYNNVANAEQRDQVQSMLGVDLYV